MNTFNTKYYKKVKENFINKTSEEKWKEKAGEKNNQKNAWCDYCLRRLVGKKKISKIIEDKHLMAFWKGDENETNFICNTCLACLVYLGLGNPLYKEKPRFLTYLGGKTLYHKWIEEWGDMKKFKKIEGKLQKTEEADKYYNYDVVLLTINNQEIYFRHMERFPFALLEEKLGNEVVVFCEVTSEGLEMRKIFSLESSQSEKEKINEDKNQNSLFINNEGKGMTARTKKLEREVDSLKEEINSIKSALKSAFSQI